MFCKKEIKDDVSSIDLDRVVRLTIFNGEEKLFDTDTFSKDGSTLHFIGPLNLCLNKITAFRVVASYLNGDRYQQTCCLLSKDRNNYVCEYNEFFLLPERRNQVKVPCDLICNCDVKGRDVFTAGILNLSTGGIFLKTKTALQLGSSISVDIPELNIKTYIQPIRRQEDYSGYGCKFLKLNRVDTESITRFIFKRQSEEREKFLRFHR